MATINTNPQAVDEVLSRAVNEVIDQDSLRSKLLSGKQLRIKLGIDPTGPQLHIGRSIPLLKLRDFADLGHQVVLIVGDFTGQIGDTSDKDAERPMLTEEQVHKNSAGYMEQLGLILDLSKTEVVHNSDWLASLTFREIAGLADAFSVHEFTERDVIKRRIDAGKRVNMRELLYPIMQGYDSIAIKADVEIGGTDQRFNMLAGRILTKQAGMPAQDIVMTELVSGSDGSKMSTSRGNTVLLTAEPNEMFGAIMSVRDELIIPYFTYMTRVPMTDVLAYTKQLETGTNPRDVKLLLAKALVGMYHDAAAATAAEEHFVSVFSQGEQPLEMLKVKVKAEPTELSAILVEIKAAASKSAAKRLIEQGAVRIDGAALTEPDALITPHDGMVVNVGKRTWRRLII